MSGRHCELVLENGLVLVRDLGSRNGTLVNGVPIRTVHRLEDGDVILVGDTELRVAGVGAGAVRK
jgi:pSer/pThr/pTyr-binding forkhead associated (FHA) protein